jgi:hypothetical protein
VAEIQKQVFGFRKSAHHLYNRPPAKAKKLAPALWLNADQNVYFFLHHDIRLPVMGRSRR